MKRFLVLYRSEAALNGMSASEMFARATPEQMKAGMGAWHAWHEKARGAVVDLGHPLDHSTTVTPESSTQGKSSITGYTTLQASSPEEAVALMQTHPHFHMPGATIEVLECLPIPGIE